MDRILIIMKKNNGHQGIICPFTGAFFHNMQTCLLVYTYNRSQVSVYRTIGPLVMLVPGGLEFLISSTCFAWRQVMSISKSHVLTACARVNCNINAWLSLH